ncbi:MAG: metallophosphoesterase family protein [Myxococcota bacterium]
MALAIALLALVGPLSNSARAQGVISLAVENADMEDVSDVFDDGSAWETDLFSIVGAENGIVPRGGSSMVRFDATMGAAAGSENAALVTQEIDLSAHAASVASGRSTIRVSSFFNRVAGSVATDTQFSIVLIALDSGGAGVAAAFAPFFSDADPGTWESHEATLVLPSTTSSIRILIGGVEDVTNDLVSPEFDGHYADDVEARLEPSLLLVPLGATWLYLDDGSDQGTAWRAAGFADGSWSAGPAQLGYGDGGEATVVNGGPAGNRQITTYFRIHFDVADPGSIGKLTLGIVRDDGAIVYLNGTEVYRTNMPAGSVDSDTRASSAIGGAAESALNSTPVVQSLLVSGENVLAVEIHQVAPTSSDISFDLELVTEALAGVPGLVRGPYLQLGTQSSMIVRWRTDSFTDTRLAYGLAPGSLSTTISDPTLKIEHEVSISGLAADTKYYYEVGNAASTLAGNDADHYFNTSPVAGTQRTTRIWVIGDSGQCAQDAAGCNDATAVMNQYLSWVASHGGNLAELVLILGDNAYNSGTDTQYTTGLFEVFGDILRNHVLWPVPGNHEFGASDSPTQTGPYYEAFTLPTAGEGGGVASGTEAYYSFDFGNIHFAALDSHDTSRTAPLNPETEICPGGGGGGSMYNWLCTDLGATNQDWLFTFWHHPAYTKGSHNSDTESQLVEMRERFNPVIEAYGADINLTGHSHSYERSVLIDRHYGVSSSYNPSTHAKDAGDGDPSGDGAYEKRILGPDPNQGAVYSVVGSSSKNAGGLTQHPIMAYWENIEGSLVIDIDGRQLDGYFIDLLGNQNDHFRILKGCGTGSVPGDDDDGDGACDDADNCLGLANPDQIDSDQDGYGNLCDPDLNEDDAVGLPDFNDLRLVFGLSCSDPGYDADADFNSDCAIGVPDFNIYRNYFLGSPGPSGYACAGTIPCPDPNLGGSVSTAGEVADSGSSGDGSDGTGGSVGTDPQGPDTDLDGGIDAAEVVAATDAANANIQSTNAGTCDTPAGCANASLPESAAQIPASSDGGRVLLVISLMLLAGFGLGYSRWRERRA